MRVAFKKVAGVSRIPGTKLTKGHWQLTKMIFPGMLFVFIFSYLPMVGLIVAFKDYKYNLGIFHSAWVGLKNFEYLFNSNTFNVILRNTLGYNLVFIVLGVVASVFTALMLDLVNRKTFVKIFQSSMFLPYFLSWIVVSYISHSFLDFNTGIINKIIHSMGMEKISFYSEPKYWRFILTGFNLWKGIGFGTLVYYGSILSIDSELFEAATIDGCTYAKRVWYITLPHLKQTVIMLTLLSLGGIFRSDYGLFFYLPKDVGALYSTTDVIDTYILRSLRVSGSVGDASAAGFLQSVVGFIVVVSVNALVRRIDDESALF